MIIDLYEVVTGEKDSAEYHESIDAIKEKYVSFKVDKLKTIIEDMKKVKLITGQKIDMAGFSVPRCSLSWWLLKIHKFFRYIYVSFYYYLTPFFILVFQTVLLYSHELYTQYLKEEPTANGDTSAMSATTAASAQGQPSDPA